MQIQGEPAGGIRRHVHSIIFGLRGTPGLKQSYACAASGGDAGYIKDLPALTDIVEGRLLTLDIKKRPGFSDLASIRRLARFVKDEKVTLVHGHGAKGGAYARILSKLCGVKSVYTPHGGSLHKMFSRPEELLYTAAEKFLFGFTGYFLFESNYSAEAYFEKTGKMPANWSVNYSGIPVPDMEKLQLASRSLGYAPEPHKVPDIGVFGILRPQKGQLYAITAMAELAKMNINARLHLYGFGPDKVELEKAVAIYGLTDKVVFHGQVADPEAHMLAMDIVLIPSLFESFGYVAIEAFSLKKPVIASSAGGLKEIIRDGREGLLVKPGDSHVIALACEKLLKDRPLAQLLAANGRARFISEFSESKMLDGIKKVYAKICPGFSA
jgi:glycosyltransferase involved in cell wall biosynthesis